MNHQTLTETTRPSPAGEDRLARYLESVWPSSLSRAARLNLLALYRGIAAGADGGLPAPHPELPAAWLERDARGRLAGVAGLSRAPTRHVIGTSRLILYAWCAFDCMFLPAVLGRRLDVESRCPASGRKIELSVSASGVERVSPPGAVISFVTPDAAAVEQRLRTVFCCHVRFVDSEASALAQLPPGATLVTPEMARRLGAIRNRTVFGDTLPDSQY